jgi:hypothetical protein
MVAPTWPGKTVLLKNLLAEPQWLSGGNIGSLDSLWLEVADKLSVNTEFSASDEQSESEERHREAGGAFFVQGSAGSSDQVGRALADTRGRSRPIVSAARDALAGDLHPLVIDDFHYIDAEVQLVIVRSLRELVWHTAKGLPTPRRRVRRGRRPRRDVRRGWSSTGPGRERWSRTDPFRSSGDGSVGVGVVSRVIEAFGVGRRPGRPEPPRRRSGRGRRCLSEHPGPWPR